MNMRLAILVLVLGSGMPVRSQQPLAVACPDVESLKLPDESAKRLSEYVRTIADSVNRSWNSQPDIAPQKQWSVLVRLTISKEGQVSGVNLTVPSGDKVIDESVSDTIRRASPVPAPPSVVNLDCIAIGLNLSHPLGQKLVVTTGGGVFRVGGGVSAPKAIFAPGPEYSKEARKAKYQGVCILSLIVGADGNPRDIHVARSLGMGLDEKAIQAIRRWKFQPAMKDGNPVAVAINVQVTFRL